MEKYRIELQRKFDKAQYKKRKLSLFNFKKELEVNKHKEIDRIAKMWNYRVKLKCEVIL